MDRGLFASLDRGRSWVDIRNNLPRVSVRGIKIQPQYNDLVIGTHGVGAWILDNVQPFVELAGAMENDVHLFDIREATDWESWSRDSNLGRSTFQGENPREGAYIDFYLAEAPDRGGVTIRITDSRGRLVRELTNVRAAAGVNRVIWNLTWTGADPIPGSAGGGFGGRGGGGGAPVAPGTYTATLLAHGQELSKEFHVRGDPEVESSQADYEARTEAALRSQEIQSGLNRMIGTVMDLQAQLEGLQESIRGKELPNQDEVRGQIEAAMEALTELDNDLRRPPPRMGYRQYPRLSEQISFASRRITQAQARPTEGQLQVIGEVEAAIGEAEGRLQAIIDGPIGELNRVLGGQARILVGGG
jgi:hypothetical protein